MSTAAISLPRVARHNPLAAIGVVLVVLFVLCALFAPWLAPQDPSHIDLPNRLDPPGVSNGAALMNSAVTSALALFTERASRCWWAAASYSRRFLWASSSAPLRATTADALTASSMLF